jgi:putative transcriptional regulator
MNHPALAVAVLALGGLYAPLSDVTRPAERRSEESAATCRPQPKLDKGMLLVASRSLEDQNFSEVVVLLIAAGPNGAMGLIINRPSDVKLTSVLPSLKSQRERRELVYLGGPVLTHNVVLLIRSGKPLDNAIAVFDDVYASSSLTVLKHESERRSSKELFRAFAGHAGWGPGQLEAEMGRGDWYITPADADTVLTTKPRDLWGKLIQRVEGDWVWQGNRELCSAAVGHPLP